MKERFTTMRRLECLLTMVLFSAVASAESAETTTNWAGSLARMKFNTGPVWLTRSNCAESVFQSLAPDPIVKAVVFLPGATDELYFFRRVNVLLTNTSPSLLDVVQLLTNHSPLRVVFHAPMLLIHSEEDVLDLELNVEHSATVEKLMRATVSGRQEFLDRDWRVLREHLTDAVPARISPLNRNSVTRHFYRHTFAAWNLSAWETIQATAYAGKTRVTIRRNHVEFDLDERMGRLPKLDRFPN